MHSNDNHLRVNDPKQQYERFYFSLTEPKPESKLELAWIVVWRGEDKEAPSSPQVHPVREEKDGITISWDASSDNLMVRGYELLQNTGTIEKPEWKVITFCTGTRCSGAGLENVHCAIRAVDVAGNRSEPSVFTVNH